MAILSLIGGILSDIFGKVLSDMLKTPAKEAHIEKIDTGLKIYPINTNVDFYSRMLNRG